MRKREQLSSSQEKVITQTRLEARKSGLLGRYHEYLGPHATPPRLGLLFLVRRLKDERILQLQGLLPSGELVIATLATIQVVSSKREAALGQVFDAWHEHESCFTESDFVFGLGRLPVQIAAGLTPRRDQAFVRYGWELHNDYLDYLEHEAE